MIKRLCLYNNNWETEFNWIKPVDKDKHKANCTLCNSSFDIGSMGRVAIGQHAKNQTHIKNVKINCFSQGIKKYVISKESEEDLRTTAAELSNVYHTIKHHHSYNSLDCGFKLNTKIYHDSKISNLISCGRTKAEAFVCSVLGKKALSLPLSEIKNPDVPVFFAIQTDASNKKI